LASNRKPTNDEMWMYLEGKNPKEAKDSVDGVLFFGITQAFASPDQKGCWVRIDFQSMRDTDINVPSFAQDQNPLF